MEAPFGVLRLGSSGGPVCHQVQDTVETGVGAWTERSEAVVTNGGFRVTNGRRRFIRPPWGSPGF